MENTYNEQLKTDLEKFEERYRYLLRHTNMLYERPFQIVMSIIMIGCVLLLTYAGAGAWYSYVFTLLFIAGTLYMFRMTDQLRAALKVVPKEGSLLEQMHQRKKVLALLAEQRMGMVIQMCLTITAILSQRAPDRLFDTTGIFTICGVVVFLAIALYQYRKKVTSTRLYLNNILAVLEQQ